MIKYFSITKDDFDIIEEFDKRSIKAKSNGYKNISNLIDDFVKSRT